VTDVKRLSRVLFPTDFSESARHAMAAALEVATVAEAELHLLHAVVLHQYDPVAAGDKLDELENEILQRWEGLAAAQLRKVADGGGGARTIVTAERRGTSAAAVILDYVREVEADLVVMGTHGRRGPSHLLLGSTAEEVVRHADCPVLTIRQESEPRFVTRARRLLVPVDFSDHARRALAMAKTFAREAGAGIDVLHVIEQLVHPAFYTTGKTTLLEVDEGLGDRCRENMAKLFAAAGGPEIPAEYHVVEGKAAREIVRFAEDHGSDAIVIATHGLTGLKNFLLGSVTAKVVRRAPCPVLTYKAFGRSFLDGS
jgi:nucleotide-binding universal stress UspA family protein